MLAGKKILLGICGSIAAYKSALLCRLLIQEGADVKVVMTHEATNFITSLTMATLSKHPVYNSFYKESNGEWHNHVELGLWADVFVIAPLTASTLAKLAHGQSDNLLTATYLSARCPVILCPAMDLDMYQHPATLKNLETVRSYGNQVIDATTGELASGLHGQGRMAEPEDILKQVTTRLSPRDGSLTGRKVLITSGPTQEAIDPVRYIGNRSTGKMGKAIAMEMAYRGAHVTFVSGPVANYPEHTSISIRKVNSAREMLEEVGKVHSECDIAIFAAAVADYRPTDPADKKIKRDGQSVNIVLIENPDIAKEMGLRKSSQLHVGFALETNDEEANAQAKLAKKNFDLIVLNSLQDDGAGFAHNTNKVSLYDLDNNVQHFELKSKEAVAIDLANAIESKLNA